jgi:hypothetical protein
LQEIPGFAPRFDGSQTRLPDSTFINAIAIIYMTQSAT